MRHIRNYICQIIWSLWRRTYTFTFFRNYLEELTEPVDVPNDLAYFCLVDMFTPCNKKWKNIFQSLLSLGKWCWTSGPRMQMPPRGGWLMDVDCRLLPCVGDEGACSPRRFGSCRPTVFSLQTLPEWAKLHTCVVASGDVTGLHSFFIPPLTV